MSGDQTDYNYNPFTQLAQDWQAAQNGQDANAPFCTFMTVSHEGRPTGRIVGLRDICSDKGTLLVFASTTSPKVQQLQGAGYEILLFWTTPCMLQYRIQGSAWSTLDTDKFLSQWQQKPRSSKFLDHYYQNVQPQSSVLVGGREQFQKQMQSLQDKFAGEEIPFASEAVGLVLEPDLVEEWRASNQDRLHERYLYRRGDKGGWTKETLVP